MRALARASAFSCVVMAVGDATRQRIQGKKWDPRETLRFAVVGATLHGPFFLYGFGAMEKLPFLSRVKSALGRALAKTAVTQITIYPLFIGLFYGYLALLEGVPIASKVQPATDTFVHGGVFWPIANMVNFSVVPPSGRVFYAAGVGVFWNTYLSYLNSRHNDKTVVATTT